MIQRPLLTCLLVLAACGPPSTPTLSLTWSGGGEPVRYEAKDSAGVALPLTFEPSQPGLAGERPLIQRWHAAAGGDKADVTMQFGIYLAVVSPTPAFSRSTVAFTSAGGTEVRGDYHLTDVRFTGDSSRPVLYDGVFSTRDSSGTFTLGPWCASGDRRSNFGCGHVMPEGTSSAEFVWAGEASIDGCSGKLAADFGAGTWRWDGKEIVLAGGRRLPCVLTGGRELVCGGSWEGRLGTRLGTEDPATGKLSCPYRYSAIITPSSALDGGTNPQVYVVVKGIGEALGGAGCVHVLNEDDAPCYGVR